MMLHTKYQGSEPHGFRVLDKKIFSCFSVFRPMFVFFVFVDLRPISTAMVIAGRSVHLTTLFPGQA